MEYTKDMILNVKYGQVGRKTKRYSFFEKMSDIIRKHRLIISIILITLMLMFLDFMLISSFVNVLSNIK